MCLWMKKMKKSSPVHSSKIEVTCIFLLTTKVVGTFALELVAWAVAAGVDAWLITTTTAIVEAGGFSNPISN